MAALGRYLIIENQFVIIIMVLRYTQLVKTAFATGLAWTTLLNIEDDGADG